LKFRERNRVEEKKWSLRGFFKKLETVVLERGEKE